MFSAYSQILDKVVRLSYSETTYEYSERALGLEPHVN